ncbi:NADPH-dependent F420 reductase [soil metagenome]
MKVALIGAGRMGTALAKLLVEAGHEVVLSNSRGPESLAESVADIGGGSKAAGVIDAVEAADVVVLATPWPKTQEAVAAVADWTGKLVVDTTNNRRAPGPDGLIDIGGQISSEVVASYVPGAHVVKAFNVTPIPMMAAALGSGAGENNAVYIAGDDADAKQVVAQLISSIGGEAVDTGDLHTGGRLQGTGGPLSGRLEMQTPTQAREYLQEVQAN